MILADKSMEIFLDLVLGLSGLIGAAISKHDFAQVHAGSQRLGLGPISTIPALTGKCV